MTEEERDAHLREALRHAPDAQLQPPPALSALILSEAHAKARDGTVPARPPRSALAAAWSWLARPSVATGFAGVMVATLVGLMWWDQPMDEAQPRRPGPATTAAPVVVAPVTPPPVAARAAPVMPPAPIAAAEPAQPSRSERRKAAPAAEQSDKKSAPAAKPGVMPAAPPVPAPAPPAESRAAPAQYSGEATASVAAQAAPSSSPPPAPAPPATAAATAPARIAADAALSGGLAKSKSADETKLTRSLAANDAVRSNAVGKLDLNASRQRKEGEAARPTLAALRAAIAAEPARWTWQRGNGPAQDMNDAVYAWLAQLDSAAGSTWQSRAARETMPSASHELRLMRDGRVLHSLRLSDSSVLWDSGSASWQAELPAAALQALESTAP